VNGQTLRFEVIEADDQDSDAGALAAAQALVAQDVSAVIGHLTSGASIAAAPVYAKAHVPQLSTATKPQYTQLGHATTLRLVANDRVQAQALASFCLEHFGTPVVGLLDDGSVYGKGLADAAKQEFGQRKAQVAFHVSLDAKARDFASVIEQVRTQRVSVLLTTMELPQVTPLLKQLARAGLSGVTVVGGDTLKVGPLPDAAAGVAGFFASTPFVDMMELPEGRAFAKKYLAAYGQDAVDGSHYAYDAMHVIASTLQSSRGASREALVTALKQADPVAPVTGYLRFNPQGEQRFAAVGIYAARAGKWALLARSDTW